MYFIISLKHQLPNYGPYENKINDLKFILI